MCSRKRNGNVQSFRDIRSAAEDLVGSFLAAIHLTDRKLICFRMLFAARDMADDDQVRNLPFLDKSFDYCLSVEVLEHLNKNDGLIMLKEMERVARLSVMLTTPNGFLPASPGPQDNPQEKHVCGWSVKELRALGFEVYGFGTWKNFIGKKYVRRLFDKLLGTPEPFLNQHPELAFQLFCFKELRDI